MAARNILPSLPGQRSGPRISPYPLFCVYHNRSTLLPSFKMSKSRLGTIDLVVRDLTCPTPGGGRRTLATKSTQKEAEGPATSLEDHSRYILQGVNLHVQPGQGISFCKLAPLAHVHFTLLTHPFLYVCRTNQSAWSWAAQAQARPPFSTL